MKQILLFLVAVLRVLFKVMGFVLLILLLILLIFIFTNRIYEHANTYTFDVGLESRIAEGVYIRSKKRASTSKIIVDVEGVLLQDCQLVVVKSGIDQGKPYYSPIRVLIPKGKVHIEELGFDAYHDFDVSAVLRAAADERKPMGEVKVKVRFL